MKPLKNEILITQCGLIAYQVEDDGTDLTNLTGGSGRVKVNLTNLTDGLGRVKVDLTNLTAWSGRVKVDLDYPTDRSGQSKWTWNIKESGSTNCL